VHGEEAAKPGNARRPLPTVPIPAEPATREFDALNASEQNRAGFDPTCPRPDQLNPARRGAGQDIDDDPTPHTLGFIQQGFYYTAETDRNPAYLYVARIFGDGGVDGTLGRENYIDATVIGPDAGGDRQIHQSRRAMATWATKRLTKGEMPAMIPMSPVLLTEQNYDLARAAEKAQMPLSEHNPERPS